MKNYIKRFKIKSNECNLWYWVFVYDTVEKLRLDAKRYKQTDDFDDCLAVCQPTRRIEIRPNGEEIEYSNLGAIRILTTAGSEVTAHELLHASLDIYREKNKRKADFGEHCNDAEEELCYIHGQLFSMLVSKMYKYGIWGESKPTKEESEKQ